MKKWILFGLVATAYLVACEKTTLPPNCTIPIDCSSASIELMIDSLPFVADSIYAYMDVGLGDGENYDSLKWLIVNSWNEEGHLFSFTIKNLQHFVPGYCLRQETYYVERETNYCVQVVGGTICEESDAFYDPEDPVVPFYFTDSFGGGGSATVTLCDKNGPLISGTIEMELYESIQEPPLVVSGSFSNICYELFF